MPDSHAMRPEDTAGKSLLENQPEESAGKSLLDKPLNQLTEDDIVQLTREDCRRYLKEKGMRRPSWNKSQAIQQVIMLKKLLEADSEAGLRERPNNSHSSNTAIQESVPKGTRADAKVSVSVEESRLHHVKDLNKPISSTGFSGSFASAKDESAQHRTIGTTTFEAGQMTIFYDGKVNVYDDMPADKAQAIMHIAASPLEEQLNNDATILQHLPCLPNAVSTKARHDSANVVLPTLQTVGYDYSNYINSSPSPFHDVFHASGNPYDVDGFGISSHSRSYEASMRDNSLVVGEENIMLLEGTPVEGPPTRKASVQRYLEKRKDRFKSKRKGGMSSCASLGMYFNHQTGSQIPRTEMCSPTLTRQLSTPARCSSVDNDSVKNV